ncbi:MAG: hypothetical protein KUG72_10260 [Pseudomonadales bacterium]|nr:hypothetical protein [Pseudomonadales bacterium]
MNIEAVQQRRASNAALLSLLNLTFLPVISFILLIVIYTKTVPDTIDRYYTAVSIKVNILAGIALLFVSALIVALGGFDSPLSWIYMLTYFLTIHGFFILFTTWVLVRAWTGKKLR